MGRKAEQGLRAHFNGGSAGRGLVDRVSRAGGRTEVGGSKTVELALALPAEQVLQRLGEGSRGDVRQAPAAGAKGGQPVVKTLQQDFVRQARMFPMFPLVSRNERCPVA